MAQVRVIIFTGYVFRNMTDFITIITTYKISENFFCHFLMSVHTSFDTKCK